MNPFEQRRVGTTGLSVPVLGCGCGPLGNLYRAMPEEGARRLLDEVWASGIRHFDTAPHYGQGLSERRLGDHLRQHNDENYVLSTKAGRLLVPAGYAGERHGFVSPMPFDIDYDYGYDGVMRSFEDSLQRLGLDRIDILYLHDIGRFTHGDANERYFPDAMNGGYRALDELRRDGRISVIGLGVNEVEVCLEAMEHGNWDCFLLAGRYTLLEQGALDSLLPKCVERGSSIVVGGPYNSGILVSGAGQPESQRYNYGPAPREVVEKVAAMERVCEDFDVALAAAALQFPLAHPAVVSVIPGMGRVEHVETTLAWFDTDIPAEFWPALVAEGLLREDAPLPATTRHVSTD